MFGEINLFPFGAISKTVFLKSLSYTFTIEGAILISSDTSPSLKICCDEKGNVRIFLSVYVNRLASPLYGFSINSLYIALIADDSPDLIAKKLSLYFESFVFNDNPRSALAKFLICPYSPFCSL